MNLSQSILEALESLSSNKMRSGLTVLGIVIGVAAVIAMLAVGTGAQDSITGSISGIGTNLLFVFRGGGAMGGGTEVRNPKPLTLQDAAAIADPFAAPSVELVAPVLQDSLIVSAAGQTTTTNVSGVTPDYFPLRNYTLTEGEVITEENLLGRASVAVIGPETADTLFGRREGLVGEQITIEGQPFRIIGVLAAKGGGMFGSEDNQVLIPYSTAQTRLIQRRTRDQVDMLLVEVVDSESVPSAVEEVSAILRTASSHRSGRGRFHRLQPAGLPQHSRDHHQRVDDLPGRHRGHLPAGGRHRHHEHHAGFGHRADEGDRPAESPGRAEARHPDAISHRVLVVESLRRDHRHSLWLADRVHCGEGRASPRARPSIPRIGSGRGPAGHHLLGGGGTVLRNLSRQPRREFGAGGGVEVRVSGNW